jgi:hypothetical protein
MKLILKPSIIYPRRPQWDSSSFALGYNRALIFSNDRMTSAAWSETTGHDVTWSGQCCWRLGLTYGYSGIGF